MSKIKAKKIVIQYARALQASHYSFSAIYLFGSQVKGTANRWSDIDIAVVSNRLQRDYDANRFALWKIRRQVDLRIEPHGFTVKDFANNANPMAYEIRKTGMRVV
ncbi:MAG TPA: nucleotidyltransferase domain-containing protein [Patescibacteria group bacterium]|nr:nucleotidyltransferase domain-containing protein [Patescibacteria group bacterium]